MNLFGVLRSDVWVKADNILDYVPIISTVTNCTEILAKYFFPHYLAEKAHHKIHIAVHINNKSYPRCFIGMVPVLGNLLIFIYSLKQKSPLEKLTPEAEKGNPGAMYALGLEHAKMKHYNRAWAWIDKAAKLLEPSAVYLLAKAYETGKFFIKRIRININKAIGLLERLPSSGYNDFLIGCLKYKSGLRESAIDNFVQSIEQGENKLVLNFLYDEILKYPEVNLSSDSIPCKILAVLLEDCSDKANEINLRIINSFINHSKETVRKLLSYILGGFYANQYDNAMIGRYLTMSEIASLLEQALHYYYLSAQEGESKAALNLVDFAIKNSSLAKEYVLKITPATAPKLIDALKNSADSAISNVILHNMLKFGNLEAIPIYLHLASQGVSFAICQCAELNLKGSLNN